MIFKTICGIRGSITIVQFRLLEEFQQSRKYYKSHGQKGEEHNESNDEEDGKKNNCNQITKPTGDTFETSVCILKVLV